MESRLNEITNFVRYNYSLHKMYNRLSRLEANNKKDTKQYENLKDLLFDTTLLADKLFVDHYNDTMLLGDIAYLLNAHKVVEQDIKAEQKKTQSNPEPVETYTYNGDTITIEDENNDNSLDDKEDSLDDNMYFYYRYAVYGLFKRFEEHEFEIVHEEKEKNKDYDKVDDFVYIEGQRYHLINDKEFLEKKFGESYQNLLKQHHEYRENNRSFINRYYSAYLKYESSVFYAYLLEAIDKQTDPFIKKVLIKAKYNYISCIRNIENIFLFDLDINDKINEYGKELLAILNEDDELYNDYLNKNQYIIEDRQADIVNRQMYKYKNKSDIISDILMDIYMKTIISCTPNRDDRNNLIDGLKQAEDVAKTDLDKKALQKSMDLNENYTLQYEKYNR